jgi:hypothetical protein
MNLSALWPLRYAPDHRDLSRIDAAFYALAAVGCCAAVVAGDDLVGLSLLLSD